MQSNGGEKSMGQRARKAAVKLGVMVVDVAIINASIYLAFLISFLVINARIYGYIPEENLEAYGQLVIPISIIAVIALDWVGLYRYYRKTWREILTAVFYMSVLNIILIAGLSYFTATYKYPRLVILISTIISFFGLFGWKMFVSSQYRKSRALSRVMIIGQEDEMETVTRKMCAHSRWQQEIAYSFRPEDLRKIEKRIDECDEIVICPGVPPEIKSKVLNECTEKNKWAYVIPTMEDVLITHTRVIQFDDQPALMIEKLELTFEQRLVKRLFDIVVSIIGLVLASPVFLICAIAIKRDSPGPVIYAQERLTKDSRPYMMYKFRSMRNDAEAAGPAFSSEEDPRVTKVGHVLRDYRLDELPQLWNILKGEMSVVGPRAERPHFVEQFEKATPQYRYRANVKAGLTGLAQIRGNYDTTSDDKLRYDLMYIRNYSVLYDLALIFRTVGVILTGRPHGS